MTFIRVYSLQRRGDASQQSTLIKRLAKVADDAISQDASSIAVIGVGRDQDCRNGKARTPKLAIQLNSGHAGHLDVRDQAGGFGEIGACQKISRRWEGRDRESQRPHQTPYSLTHALIIIYDRDQALRGQSHPPHLVGYLASAARQHQYRRNTRHIKQRLKLLRQE